MLTKVCEDGEVTVWEAFLIYLEREVVMPRR